MISAYLIIILCIGFYSNKHADNNDYLFASRKLTLPSFIATIVTTWYGAILEVGRYTFYNGIVTWIIFCLFYYISAFIFAFFIGPKIHSRNMKSIPHIFYDKLGQYPGYISSTLVCLIGSPIPYIMILSTIISHIYDIDILYSIFISITTSTIYIYSGGFKAIIRTDKLQFVLMYTGFGIMIYQLISSYGGYDFLINNVPQENLQITENLSLSYIFSWFFISLIIVIDPSIFQRTYSTVNIKTIKKGFLYSIGLWFVFDVLTIATGLYASALITESNLTSSPYLQLSEMVLSPIFYSIFIISLLSIVMSTIDSTNFISAITISDMINGYNKKIDIINVRWGLFITAIFSFILCYLFENAIEYWYMFGSLAASSILIPFILILYNHNINIKHPIFTLSAPILLCLIMFIYNNISIDPIYIGLSSSMILNLINSKN
tara:strand:- start:423 stop:1724 length:1302 start_codon:yes stop_codon:yes gene_type:complete